MIPSYFCDALSTYGKNRLDPVIKSDFSTHPVTTVIENTLTFVARNVKKLLNLSTKQNLDWNRIDKQTDENEYYQDIWL